MSNRQRTTWQGSGDKAATTSQPVLPVERARRASAHPAYPDEGAAHPAHQPDPTQPADYENGDTSSWAEDPTTGPYPNSAHPAYPDEGSAHPAYRQTEMGGNAGGDQMTNEDLGVSKAAARDLRAAVERKASLCIRIATALLGRRATVASIEDQALDFMDLPDSSIRSTLNRLAAKDEEATEKEESEEEATEHEKKAAARRRADDRLLRRLLAEEEEATEKEESDEDASEHEKKADDRLLRRLLAEEEEAAEEEAAEEEGKKANSEILAAIQALGARIDAMEHGKRSQSDDAMLAQLLEEEGMGAADEPVEAQDDVEAMLLSMMEDEAGMEPMGQDEAVEAQDDETAMEEGELGIDMGAVEDPMGMLGDVAFDDGEAELLANLFANSRRAGEEDEDDDEDDEDEEEEEEEESEKEAKKAASRKPRPKKASAGARKLGGVSKSAASEIKELEKLWQSAPDVSGVFG